MSEFSEAAQKLQHGLEPYIKPREQVNYIRRILALHLNSFSEDAPLNQPLPLPVPVPATLQDAVKPTKGTQGLHSEYLEALQANIAARHQLESISRTRPQPPEQRSINPEPSNVNHLDERLAALRLDQKRQRLSTVRKYLDQLVDQPAASATFLEVDQIFARSVKLPPIPKQIVDSFANACSGKVPDLKTRASQLEKTVLRTKLRLCQEEKLLEEAKTRSRNLPNIVSNGVRLEALNATRTELINWIETELTMASGGEPAENEHSPDAQSDIEADHRTITKGLAEVRRKYEMYMESRKEVLSLVAHQTAAPTKPDLSPPSEDHVPEPSPAPTTHLLVPYVDRLLALSRAQRSMISQKAHMNTLLNSQLKDTCQILGHLAEESQLLPAYPMKDSLRRRSGLVNELTSKKSGKPDIATRIKPWIFASDAAKITSLESVAETIEGGQMSLEGSMKALEELEDLLGLSQDRVKEPDDEGTTEVDVWLDAGDAKDKTSRKHTGPKTQQRVSGDVWSTLHGSLGLIGQGD